MTPSDQFPESGPLAPSFDLESPASIAAREKAEIDMQIATAKQWPRSLKTFLQEAETMIAIDADTAESCNYKLKRQNGDGSIKWIEGPSIRLMEIAASAYGNLRYGSKIVGEDERFVTTVGAAHDLQRNVAVQVEVRRRISGKSGRKFSDDMVGVTTNAASSIARRNALNGVIPRAYINRLADFAKKVALGDIKTLPERRQRAIEYFTKTVGLPLERVLGWLEKVSVEDVNLEDVGKLQGLKTALKDGETSLEAEFPSTPAAVKKAGVTAAPAPANPTPAPTAAQEPEPEPEPIDTLHALMASDGVSEPQVMEFCRAMKIATKASQTELSHVPAAKLKSLVANWPALLPQIKQSPAA